MQSVILPLSLLRFRSLKPPIEKFTLKTFYQLLGNTIVSSVTNMTVWFALVFFVYLETRSVTATSIVTGIYLVATAVSGIWFGSLVDHYKKRP